jgi:Predicted hydrolases or acyltransferases (alpha/beta hydrolase superfamily)
MGVTFSKDGTRIAYDKTGDGPPLIIVAGAFQDRMAMAAYAGSLSKRFTVYNYDRRGRGESGDTQPYAIEREIEDIDALISEAGGSAFVFGGSSGGVLTLDAAAHGSHITKLAVYEPPFVVDDSRDPVPEDIVEQLQDMIASGRRGDAAKTFMTKGSLMPAEMVDGMRTQPFWPGVEAVAHTLVYDAMIMDGTMQGTPLPANRWAAVTIPTLVIYGGAGSAWSRNAAEALVELLPNAEQQKLEGQFHELTPDVLTPVLEDFFLT